MSRRNLAWLVGIPAFVVAGLALSQFASTREKEQDYELVRLVVEVLGEVDQHYVRELNEAQKKKLVEDMINGGLERLDPYSAYLPESEYKQFERISEARFGGVGIQIGPDRTTGMLSVISPMVGTPAYEAGVLAGDLIVKINDKSTENLRINEAVDLIQGPIGEPVRLTVLHEGQKEPVELTMKRAIIEVQTVLGDTRDADDPKQWNWFVDPKDKIGYVRLTAFSEPTAGELKKALEQMEKAGVRGFVLDLRDNPGGLLKGAVEVADLFLSGGKIVSTRDRQGEKDSWSAHPAGTLLEPAAHHPMAVLVNKNSASASEIVAAALQDHKRAVIVGERSFGKGSVQNILGLPRSSRDPKTALKLTTASYWRPSGKNIHRTPDMKETDDWGVRPDEGFEVPLKDEERFQYLVWRRNRDIVSGKPGTAPKPDKPKDDKPFTDKVLEKALAHIRAEQAKAGE